VSDDREKMDREHEAMVQTYRILSVVALLVIVAIEASDGLSLMVPLIVLCGLLGIVWRVPAAPILVLVFYAVGHIVRFAFFNMPVGHGEMWHRGQGFADYPRVEIQDLLMAGALVAFFATQYRLAGLRGSMVPTELRRKRRAGLGAQTVRDDGAEVRRPRRVVSLHEAPILVLVLPLWVLLGQILWIVIAIPRGVDAFPPPVVRLVTLLWLIGVPGLVIGSFFHYWRRRGMSPDEAQMYLQDTQWRQTSGEQRTIARFFAWRRLRRNQREETL
jgi:hypothetical protein